MSGCITLKAWDTNHIFFDGSHKKSSRDMKMKNRSQINPILEITQQISPGSVILKSLYRTGKVTVTFCIHTPGEVGYRVWLEHGAMVSWRTGMMFAPCCKQGWTSVFPQALCLDLPVTFLFCIFWKSGQDGYKDHSFRMHLLSLLPLGDVCSPVSRQLCSEIT